MTKSDMEIIEEVLLEYLSADLANTIIGDIENAIDVEAEEVRK